MADSLTRFFSPPLVRRLAGDLVRAHPAFPQRTFVRRACAGLEALELLDRGRHIARALAACLPAAYPAAIDVLLRSLGLELRSTSRAAQELLVDVAVHFVKARGTSRKVFKLARLTLPPRGRVQLRTSFSLAVHTTRVPRPGRHAVDVIVNGHARPAGSFQVRQA